MSSNKTTKSSRVRKLLCSQIAHCHVERFDKSCHQTSEQQHTSYSDQHSVTMLLSNAQKTSLSCRTSHPRGPVQKKTTYLHRSSPNKSWHQMSPSVSPYGQAAILLISQACSNYYACLQLLPGHISKQIATN